MPKKKKQTKRKPVEQVTLRAVGGGPDVEFCKDLYDRAKRLGVNEAVIASYSTSKALKAYLDSISPTTNPDAFPKQTAPVNKAGEKTEPIPATVEFDSEMESQWIMQDRSQFDEANLQSKLREMNRGYGAHKPIRIVMDRDMVDVMGVKHDITKVLITHVTIVYRKDKNHG